MMKQFESHSQNVSNFKAFINSCSWEGINYPSKIWDWERSEKKVDNCSELFIH